MEVTADSQAPRNVTVSLCLSKEDADLITRAGNRRGSRSAVLYSLIDQKKLARLRAQIARETAIP